MQQGILNNIIKDSGLILKYREVDEVTAKREIHEFILKEKLKGNTKVSVFDLVTSLMLPPEQVEKILEMFEDEGKISEIDE